MVFTFICPECGQELVAGRHDIDAHVGTHWPVYRRDTHALRNPIARSRAEALFAASDAAKASLSPVEEAPPVNEEINIIEGDI